MMSENNERKRPTHSDGNRIWSGRNGLRDGVNIFVTVFLENLNRVRHSLKKSTTFLTHFLNFSHV